MTEKKRIRKVNDILLIDGIFYALVERVDNSLSKLTDKQQIELKSLRKKYELENETEIIEFFKQLSEDEERLITVVPIVSYYLYLLKIHQLKGG